MGFCLLLMLVIPPQIEQPAMDFGVEGFHSTLKDFGGPREVRDFHGGNAGCLESLGRSACGEDFDAVCG